ncbi:hypothetical protein Pla110_44090 [Polystyrenella longa]|uniref:Uncharacterized protein n=1 Tax=Polystyrenella longa TaxID=2528007 RepID=A0A518CTW6_9PLAN|nr:hypothetical protein [Polystyrenella longa]QDU82648.1 hypothetical protein Pla110_44090 [Polystyrenella longa]
MATFIKLTESCGDPLIINSEVVAYVDVDDDGDSRVYKIGDDEPWMVTEDVLDIISQLGI